MHRASHDKQATTPLYPLGILASLLPLLTIHLSYIWAASNGHVDWCFPYIQSCTSISATGREPPEYYLFKAMMIPSAVFIAAYWWFSYQWLDALGCQAKRRRKIVLVLGLIACVGLILYSVMLGSIGDIYRLQRRIGVTTFFGLTYLAQLLITYLLSKTDIVHSQLKTGFICLQITSWSLLIMGLSSVALSAYDENYYDSVEDAFEWSFTLLLCVYVFITALMWKKTNFAYSINVN